MAVKSACRLFEIDGYIRFQISFKEDRRILEKDIRWSSSKRVRVLFTAVISHELIILVDHHLSGRA